MDQETKPEISIQISPRPFGVTLLALAVLTIAAIYMIRLVQAIQQWGFLASLPGVSPAYLAFTGLLWMLADLPLAWGIWRGKPWAPLAAALILPAFFLYAWIDRLLISNPAITISSTSSWPFCLGVTLLFLLAELLIITRPKSKAFFRRES